MTEGDIALRFILAAQTDRALPAGGTRPKGIASLSVPYVHTEEDRRGWDKSEQEDQRQQPTAAEISALDECARWVAECLDDPRERRALWNWSISKAGGRSFKAWCFKIEGVHPETGRRRKDRAISRIASRVDRNALMPLDLQHSGVLAEDPESGYKSGTVENDAPMAAKPSWRDDPSLRPIFDESLRDLRWSDDANERRRKRAARDKAA